MDLILWVFGGLVTLISVLAGILYRQLQKRLDSIEKDIKVILGRTDFVAFIAMDKKREELWTFWRDSTDKKIASMKEHIATNESNIARLSGLMNGRRE
jgi:hypothetical protein